jgi:hypothetical protein
MSTTETSPRPSHTGRTVALIVVGVVVTAMIVWLATGVVRAATRPDASGTFEIEEPFDSVVLDSDLADVDIAYRDVARSELTLRQGDSREGLELDHEVRGDTLHISLRHVRELGMPLWWPWFGDRSPQLELVLPAALEREPVALEVSTDVGDIDTTGAFADVSLRSSVGDIELDGSAESLAVHTDAGEIGLERFSTEGELTARSGVGDVTMGLEALPSGIRVETEAGEVHVDLPQGRYALTADTSLGDVDIDADNDSSAARQYEFTTSVGDISVRS